MKSNDHPSTTQTAAQILHQRALALARPVERAPEAATRIEVLEFRLAQERYAVETTQVREVYPLKELTPLPCTPSFVLGVVNVRGRILPVFDLKKFFDLPLPGITDLHRIIIIRGADMEFGLLADVIIGVHSLALETLQPTLPTLTGIRADYLKGVTSDALVVLDLNRLLADPRIIVDEEVGN